MICLRSGHCCKAFDVIIVDDPDLGILEENLIHKPSGQKCKHLLGSVKGKYACALHDRSYYKETPCFAFTQIESGSKNCRLGEYHLRNNHEC